MMRTAGVMSNSYRKSCQRQHQIGFTIGASGSQRAMRVKSIGGCEIGHSRAAYAETKPLLRRQNDFWGDTWRLKNRGQNLNNSLLRQSRRFGQKTTYALDLLNSVSVPRSPISNNLATHFVR
jgi:hypothetical protein